MTDIRILFACGGTGGHINPAIAIANYIKLRQKDAVILFAGNPKGMEATLVPQAGFDFAPIVIMGIQRQLNWFNIKYNTQSMFYLATAQSRSRKLIKSFAPDIIIGTGGYVSGPILQQGARMGIKTLAHEQNAYPGVTNKILSKCADKMLLAVEEANHILHCKNYAVVGNPIREEIIYADRDKARKDLGVGERICVLSFGGSLGAQRMNEAIAEVMKKHYKEGNVYHIHATGKLGVELMPKLLGSEYNQVTASGNVDIREYISDMHICMAAADIIIGRAGAITLSELEAAGRASILIPSPNVSANHQYHNAKVLEKRGAAVVIEEKNLTGDLLWEEVSALVANPERIKSLGENAHKMAIIDSGERIYREVLALLNPK